MMPKLGLQGYVCPTRVLAGLVSLLQVVDARYKNAKMV